MDDYRIFDCCCQISVVAFARSSTQEIEEDLRVVTSLFVLPSLLLLLVSAFLSYLY